MSVIDDLKQEAERRKQQMSDREAQKARKEDVYQNQMRPAMQAVFRYLNEMTEQLNLVKPDVGLSYVIPNHGTTGKLVQEDYRLSVDSTEQPKFIKFWFTCRSPEDLVFSVKPRSKAHETRGFMQDLRLEFSEWPLRDALNNLMGLGFEVKFVIPVIFLFKVDMENEVVSLNVTNFEGFKVLQDSFRPDTVNHQWLEDLGNYILGRNVNLRALNISDQERQRIRQQLQQTHADRQKELKAALERECLEKQLAEDRQLKNRLLKMVQQGKELAENGELKTRLLKIVQQGRANLLGE